MTERAHDENCLFCKIAAGTIPAQLVHASDDIVAFRDIQPQAPVHLLVIPREHIATLNDLQPDHAQLLGRLILTAQQLAAQEGLAENGYRLTVNCNRDGGQSVYHIHLHLLGGRRLAWPPG